MSEREEQVILQFSHFLKKLLGQDISYRAIPTTHSYKTPDFLLEPINYLVEIKEIVDQAEVKISAAWGGTTKRLHSSIDGNEKMNSIEGGFLVDTPYPFHLPNDNALVDRITNMLLDGIIGSNEDRFTIEAEGFRFKVSKYSTDAKHISFSWTGNVRSIDPPTTVNENIAGKVVSANLQLAYNPPGVDVSTRVLLLVNDYIFARESDVITGLSYSLEDLNSLDSIDQIWVQHTNHSTKETEHELILTKQFIRDFQNNIVGADSVEIFEKWFLALDNKGDEYKDKLVLILRQIFTDQPPHALIKGQYVREQMVRLGEWLIEKERFDEAKWIIETFIDDPNPPTDPSIIEDPERNLDQQIRDGKKNQSITTVLGHLAWVVQKLTIHKLYITDALHYTKKLATHPNLYVKLQALVPLIEITQRRAWLKEIDAEKGTNYYQELKDLDFELLNNYSQYPALGDWLAHMFFYFRDLDTSEIVQVLDKLKNADEASALYVYFAIFRKNHYKSKDGTYQVPFDRKVIEDKLKTILENAQDNESLVGSIVWQFGKLLREAPDDFEEVKPWVDIVLDQPFQKDVIDHLSRSLNTVYTNHPDIAVRWLKIIIDKSCDYVNNTSVEEISRSFWLELNNINWIAERDPDSLAGYLEKAFQIWKKGAYIGDPPTILTSYQYIENDELKRQVKEAAQSIYSKMKKLHPPLKDVQWL